MAEQPKQEWIRQTGVDREYSEHFESCSNCLHQAYCEAGYQFRELLRGAERE